MMKKLFTSEISKKFEFEHIESKSEIEKLENVFG